MATKKITQFNSLAQIDLASASDVLPIVDVGAPETKKITAREAEQIVAELKEGYDKIRFAHQEGIKREEKSA